MPSSSQSRARSRNGNRRYSNGRGREEYDEQGKPLAPLRLGDSASVAGQDYDEGMPRQDIVPGDSRSAMGQTVASGMNNGGGAAITVGPNGPGGLFNRPDSRGEQSMHDGAPNDGSRVGRNPRAVLEWQAEAGALRGSCEKLELLVGKERQDRLLDAEKRRDDLAPSFHAMDTDGQGKCMPLMRSINTLLDRQIAEQRDDRPVGVSQEPSGMNDPLKKGNVGEEGKVKDFRTGPAPNEDNTLYSKSPPLSPFVRSTQEGQSGRPPGTNQEKKGTWPTH
jgi:hypothetical protein